MQSGAVTVIGRRIAYDQALELFVSSRDIKKTFHTMVLACRNELRKIPFYLVLDQERLDSVNILCF